MDHEEFWEWAAENRDEFTKQYEEAMGECLNRDAGYLEGLADGEKIALNAASWLMGQTSKDCEKMVRSMFNELRGE